MRTLKHLDIFSGIGMFAHGLPNEFETVGFCEINPFCQRVIAHHFPEVPIIEDIHDVTADALDNRGIRQINIITAGFPCQPFSDAGKQKGTTDERFLWPELFRVIADIRPEYIILENVPALLKIQSGLIFRGILYDLSAAGYDAEWQVISARDVGAPHLRERLWVVATNNTGKRTKRIFVKAVQGQSSFSWCEDVGGVEDLRGRSDIPEPLVRRISDGYPEGVDALKAIGNSIVPDIAGYIGGLILEHYESA